MITSCAEVGKNGNSTMNWVFSLKLSDEGIRLLPQLLLMKLQALLPQFKGQLLKGLLPPARGPLPLPLQLHCDKRYCLCQRCCSWPDRCLKPQSVTGQAAASKATNRRY
jgi:hypothetical protein